MFCELSYENPALWHVGSHNVCQVPFVPQILHRHISRVDLSLKQGSVSQLPHSAIVTMPRPFFASPFISASTATFPFLLYILSICASSFSSGFEKPPNPTTMLPLFHKVRYTPLGERSLCRRPRGVLLLKYAALAFLTLLLLVLVVYFSGVNRILSAPEREEPPPPPPEPEEGMLGFARGPRILVPEIPKEFQTVGVVFYGRRSRVEILDCYLKVVRCV